MPFRSFYKCPLNTDSLTNQNLQEPQFPQLVLKTNVEEHMNSVKTSLTDMGLCTTINANSISGTFNTHTHEKIKAFADILDDSDAITQPIKVQGSG